MTARVFILEDHPSVRDSIIGFVSRLSETEVCGAAASAEEALTQLADANADLVLVDVSLPGMNGFDFLREAKRRWPRLLCLVLSGHDESAYSKRALSLGARGYVAKGNATCLQDAIRCVLEGGTYRGNCADRDTSIRPASGG